MKLSSILIFLISTIVLFPQLSGGVFVDLANAGAVKAKLPAESVNLILLGIGLTFVGTRV